MIGWYNFIVGFVFSFIGSIPPGTINLSVIQLGLQKRMAAAFRMVVAAAFVEFFYAAIAIKFQIFVTSRPAVQENFQLISASVLLLLGIGNLIAAFRSKPGKPPSALATSGFRKGMLLAIGNPLNIPFWIGVTAYLQSNRWVNFDDVTIWSYVLGISLGTVAILLLLALAAHKTGKFIQPENKLIKIVPGVVLVALGLWGLADLYIL